MMPERASRAQVYQRIGSLTFGRGRTITIRLSWVRPPHGLPLGHSRRPVGSGLLGIRPDCLFEPRGRLCRDDARRIFHPFRRIDFGRCCRRDNPLSDLLKRTGSLAAQPAPVGPAAVPGGPMRAYAVNARVGRWGITTRRCSKKQRSPHKAHLLVPPWCDYRLLLRPTI